MIYTEENIRNFISPSVERYLLSLSVGRPDGWTTDQRSKDMWCLGQWIREELILLDANDDDRRRMEWSFNRNIRAEEDLFTIAANVMNNFINGKIDMYAGR